MYPYQNPSLSTDERVEDLLSRMTLEEKFAQMRLLRPDEARCKEVPFDVRYLEENADRCGGLYNPHSLPVESINAIQDWYRNHTRLGIPIAIHGESLHGVMNANATAFPQAVGLMKIAGQ